MTEDEKCISCKGTGLIVTKNNHQIGCCTCYQCRGTGRMPVLFSVDNKAQRRMEAT